MPKKTKLQYKDFRPLRKGDLGFRASARRYVSPSTGEILSLRQFQKLAKTQQQPISSSSTPHTTIASIQTKTTQSRYKDFVSSFQAHHNIKRAKNGLPLLSRRDVMRDASFKEAYAIIKNANKRKKIDKSPSGKLAQALVAMGLRQPEWEYPVGQTPD